MPIRRPSAARPRLAALIALAGWAGMPSAGTAQVSPGTEEPSSARSEIEREGNAAMERLRGAISRPKVEPVHAPSELPEPTEAERRRAFEALRGHSKSPAMESRARDALKAGKDRFAAEREAMAKRLGQALGLEAPDMKAIADAGPAQATKGWVPVLFVSSSMPTATLRTYAAQVEKARGVIAFRGMPGGMTKVAPMAKLTAEMLRLDPGCEGPAWLARVPVTRSFPPNFAEELRGAGGAFIVEMSTAPGCLPCADLWPKLQDLGRRYGWRVRALGADEAMLRSGRVGLPWVGHPVAWVRPVKDANRIIPIAVGTDHSPNLARNLYLSAKMLTGVKPAVGVRALSKFTGIVGNSPGAPSQRSAKP